jgi:CRISPR-associated protein Cas1
MFLPLADHSEVVWRLNDQLNASKPLQKHVWKQLVQAKIRAQAGNLPEPSPARSKLLALARIVRSGDPKNVEAQAAKIYWANWIPEEISFRRDADGDGINALLNYGYAILRAAVARAIVVAGLLPSLGIKHCNRSNAFALADDLIEPLRPMVDVRVRSLFRRASLQLNREAKAELLRLLADNVTFGGETGPLMVCLHRYIASFVKCLRGESRELLFPLAPTNFGRSEESDDDPDW